MRLYNNCSNYKKFVFENSSFCFVYPNFYLTSYLGTRGVSFYNFFYPFPSLFLKSYGDSNFFEMNFVNDRKNFSNVYKNILTLYKSLSMGYFMELKLVGLGFKIKALGSYFCRVYLGQSHFFYIYSPKNVIMKLTPKSIILFSNNPQRVGDVGSHILLLRPINPYKLSGILRPTNLVLLRTGKQR